ncbi:unnamed protein product [Didymodactylos carnosus]|uniref:Fatty acid hydroxylase domain-containing protein n=1 Tax=Didymodactylos carnosus TaxID=1234261 RepID=A0A815D035_9BILA|nr:unnamed protein product [Didymodactylos carnosus]CAF4096039.1 unnamed protein product [Didymodactylos carnosus]
MSPPVPRVDPVTGEKYYTSEDAMNLLPKDYEEWIYSNKTEHVDEVRLYASKFWNIVLTKSPPFLPLTRFYCACIGLVLWFPCEYLFHRFLFHLPVTGRNSQKFHLFLHGIHHLAPKDLWHVFSPVHELGVQALAVGLFFWLIGLPDPVATMSGLLLNYMRYDSIHYCIHAYTPKQLSKIPFIGNYLKQCAIHHRTHHFVNPKKHFTISSVSSLVD